MPAFEDYEDSALTRAYIDADTRSPEYLAIRDELRRRLAAGNGAEVDSLAGAAAPLDLEPELASFNQWANASPGTERQARYAPEEYAMHRESVRDGYREDAQRDFAEYGDGNMDQLKARIDSGDRDAVRLYDNRMRRNAAEDRVIRSPWQEARRRIRLEEASGVPSDQLAGMDADALREAAYRRRLQEQAARKAEVAKRAQLMLNPVAYLGRDDITPEQRQMVQDRMPPARSAAASNDPRIRVAEIGAESAAAQAAAEREARVSQQQWLETTRIAAEERAAARADANAVAQRNFDAEQKELDRAAQATAGDRASNDVVARLQADLDARRLEHEAQMAALARQSDEAQRRHEASMSESRIQADERMQQFEGRYGLDKDKMEADVAAQQEGLARVQREQLLGSMESSYGPGVRSIADGDDSTPEAQAALRKMARASDQTWLGFWRADGQRLDNLLARLGVDDPARRRALVERFGYGLENNFFGAGGDGRGGALSYWLAGRPQ
jgi:hypothetical protein